MSSLKCPKCSKTFHYCGDYEGFYQEPEQEFTCPHCETEFLATVVYSIDFMDERLKDSINTEVEEED